MSPEGAAARRLNARRAARIAGYIVGALLGALVGYAVYALAALLKFF